MPGVTVTINQEQIDHVTVTNVNEAKRMARVKFQSEGMTSGWLHILSSTGIPRTNTTVLCLYLPVFNADGFILGAI